MFEALSFIGYILKFGLAISLNILASNYAHNTAHKYLKEPYTPLYDTLQVYARTIPLYTPDFVLLCLLVYSIIFLDTIDDILFYRQLNTLCYTLLVRPIFICVTTFPTCMESQQTTTHISLYNQLLNSTHDLMFSGHSCMFIFFGKIMDNNIGYFIQFPLPLILVLSRQHYTIDVLVSYVVYNYIELIT